MPSIYQSTCQGTCDVSGAGSPAYDNAYFEINYVNIFSTASASDSTTPEKTESLSGQSVTKSNSPTTTISGGAGSSGSSRASQSSGAGAPVVSIGKEWAGLGVVVVGILAGLKVIL